jgi:hypothetical protein
MYTAQDEPFFSAKLIHAISTPLQFKTPPDAERCCFMYIFDVPFSLKHDENIGRFGPSCFVVTGRTLIRNPKLIVGMY